MLPQSFPSYLRSQDQGWTSKTARSTLRCSMLQIVVFYAVLWAAVWQENGAPSFSPSLALLTPYRRPVKRTYRPRSHHGLHLRSPMAIRQSGTLCHRSAWFRRPPWSMAITICPTTVNSPHLGGGGGVFQLARKSWSSVVQCSHAHNSTLILTDLLAMANGSLVHLTNL